MEAESAAPENLVAAEEMVHNFGILYIDAHYDRELCSSSSEACSLNPLVVQMFATFTLYLHQDCDPEDHGHGGSTRHPGALGDSDSSSYASSNRITETLEAQAATKRSLSNTCGRSGKEWKV
ncbi:hypothetical protein Cadr_000003090 [Camelus dromedarius]|uniref:Uncharacterized protein n=1 Tax=Camelus dromedarius TaxID=9838 RepID=A0A5N4C3S8_CAMDR|nr:hypothetical protein Cadr_000003090 [Camelus dromedarius]